MKELEFQYVIQYLCENSKKWRPLEDVKTNNLLDRLQYYRDLIRIRKLSIKVQAVRVTREPLDL